MRKKSTAGDGPGADRALPEQKIQSEMRRQGSDSIRLTNSLINAFIADISRRGGTKMTVATYRQTLVNLQELLGPERRIRSGTLREWRDDLRQRGYASTTINTRISVVNSLLDYCGRVSWKLEKEREAPALTGEGLSRAEYVRLLQAARELGEEKAYLLIKLCCVMGLTTVELQKITVEAVYAEQITTVASPGRKAEKSIPIPAQLQMELEAFAKRQRLRKGPLFRGSSGKPIARSKMLQEIKKVCAAAQVPEQSCTFRALRRLSQTTYADIQEKYRQMLEQEYTDLLDAEQSVAGWEQTVHTVCGAAD